MTTAGTALESARTAAQVSYTSAVTSAALQRGTAIAQARDSAIANYYMNDPDVAAVANAWADFEIASMSAWTGMANAKTIAYMAYSASESAASATLEQTSAGARAGYTNQVLDAAVVWVDAAAQADLAFSLAALGAYDTKGAAELTAGVAMLHAITGAVMSGANGMASAAKDRLDSFIDAAAQRDLGVYQAESSWANAVGGAALQRTKDEISALTDFLTPLAGADLDQIMAEAAAWRDYVTGAAQATLPVVIADATQAAAQGVLAAEQNAAFLSNQPASFFSSWEVGQQSPGSMLGPPVVSQIFFSVPPEQVREPVTHDSALDIPFVRPGQHNTDLQLAQSYITQKEITIPNGIYGDGAPGTYFQYPVTGTPAELARYNLRMNITAYKQRLVDQLYGMLTEYPPLRTQIGPDGRAVSTPLELTNTQRINAANKLADIYIEAVDDFLATHWGAAPNQGSRNSFLDWVGVQNESNHPWCADWATVMSDRLTDGIGDDPDLRQIFGASYAQQHSPREWWQPQRGENQHNFVVIYVAGRKPDVPYDGKTPLGEALIFDPWRTITPMGYAPDSGYWITNWGVAGGN